jgi:protein TonB
VPDGVTWRGGRFAEGPVEGRVPRYAGAAVLALALHGAAALPFLLAPDRPPAPSVLEAVEIAPVPEPAAPEAAETPSPAEAVAAAPPDPVQAAEPAPEPVQAVPPEELPPPRPEPLRAEAPPPGPAVVPAPEPVAAPPPPEEVAALPPPPPPAPAAALPRPALRPTPRPSQAVPPAPRMAEAPATLAAPAAPAPAPVRQAPPPSYVGALLAALERHKAYPQAARWRRAEGTALLRFAMRRDGAVAGWRIERSSGHEDLDGAVAEMIRRASPLPPPPPDLAGDPVELTVPVRFSLR